MPGCWKTFEQCVKCRRKQWVDRYDSEESDGGPRPVACPKCGGAWASCDPAESDQKLGDLHKCGRCQASSLGSNSALVMNAPKGMHASWCMSCIRAVNKGASPLLPGCSIDKEGFVIGYAKPVSYNHESDWVLLFAGCWGFLLIFDTIAIGLSTRSGAASLGSVLSGAAIISVLCTVLFRRKVLRAFGGEESGGMAKTMGYLTIGLWFAAMTALSYLITCYMLSFMF